jgi:superfamily II DNA/RNA helicase
LTALNEEEELEARKHYYQNAEVTNVRQMMIATKLATKGLPFMFVSFVVAYFAIGISYYNRGIKDI